MSETGQPEGPLTSNVPGAQFPRLESGRLVFRLHAPDARAVRVPAPGDSLGTEPVELSRDGDGFWTGSIDAPAPGFHYYRLQVDGLLVNDPGSQAFSGYGLAASGVEIPEPGNTDAELRDVPHGDVRSRWYHSTVTGEWRQLLIYTPPGYDADASRRYPVLYLQHGSGEDETSWSRQGRAGVILDNLLAESATEPMLIVMGSGYPSPPPEPGAPPSPERIQQVIDGFGDVLLRDVVPLVDELYRTKADRDNRALAGLSMGGRQALAVGLRSLEHFAWIAGLSPAVWMDGTAGRGWTVGPDWVQESVRASGDYRPRHVFLTAGSLESQFVTAIEDLAEVFAKAGIEHSSYVSPGTSHEWLTWRRSLVRLAPLLFR